VEVEKKKERLRWLKTSMDVEEFMPLGGELQDK